MKSEKKNSGTEPYLGARWRPGFGNSESRPGFGNSPGNLDLGTPRHGFEKLASGFGNSHLHSGVDGNGQPTILDSHVEGWVGAGLGCLCEPWEELGLGCPLGRRTPLNIAW